MKPSMDEKTLFPSGAETIPSGDLDGGCELVAGEIVEEAFQRGREELGRIFDWIALFMIRLDEGDRVELWTGAAERMFGLSPARVQGAPLATCGIGWEMKRVEEAIRWVRAHGRNRRLEDLPYTDGEGRSRFLSLTIIPLQGSGAPAEQVDRVVLIGYDVTARVILELNLTESRQQESLIHLVAGVARRLNSPIQFMQDNLRFLRESFTALERLYGRYKRITAGIRTGTVNREVLDETERLDEEVGGEDLWEEIPAAVDQTLEGLERVSGIVRSLQNCFRKEEGKRLRADLNEIVESTLTVTRHEWKNLARVETDLGRDLPQFYCRPGEVSRVLRHLVLNAAEAAAEAAEAGKGEAKVRVRTRMGERALEVVVSDTGPGIPEAFRARIFDPFFTTKDSAKHAGQGLAVARYVVEEGYGGTLAVDTEPEKGTTVVLRLPLTKKGRKGAPLADPS